MFAAPAPSALPALSPFRQTALLALLAVAVLTPGIWEATGLTGKDEFYLGLRTPMAMIEGHHWLVPFLDGEPRIRKPPLLYWLGRLQYEIFGISLASARALAVAFAALLVVSTAGIARRLAGRPDSGLIAGAVMLGCLGLATEGRRFMLDVPVAALSTAAFWAFLHWLDFRRFFALTASTVLLAAGFLVKGPIVALVFGGGILGLLAVRRLPWSRLRQHFPALALHAALGAALALPWFFVVRRLHPEAAARVLADELESRQFFDLSPGIALGLLNIALPWIIVFLAAVGRRWRDAGPPRIAIVWFLATFLPFLFIKSFDRYLIGSLVPLALLLALSLPDLQARWPFRLGAALALLLAALFAAFVAWFDLGGWGWPLLPMLYLAWAWWQPRPLTHRLAAPAILWLSLLAGVFPRLGINAVPADVVALGQQTPVALFNGPQPAMLPILSGRAHRHLGNRFDDFAGLATAGTPVFVGDRDLPRFQRRLAAAGVAAIEVRRYQALVSEGSGLRFARANATWDDWRTAFASRSLQPLMSTVYQFRLQAP